MADRRPAAEPVLAPGVPAFTAQAADDVPDGQSGGAAIHMSNEPKMKLLADLVSAA